MANEKNITSKTTAERLAGLLNTYYAKKTDVAAVLGTAQDASTEATVYGARALANSKVATVSAGSGINVSTNSPNSATAPEVSIRLSAKSGNNLSLETGSGEEGLYFHQADAPTVSVAEKATANTGYLKTYQVTVDGTPVGVDIDIPKDFLVKEATSSIVTAADKAAGGKFENDDSYSVGDAYLDFTINVQTGTATDEHVYVNVKNLVDVYTNGDGLNLSNNQFSVKIDASNARGLSVGANGLAMALVTPDTYEDGTKTADGTAGAMSSADKYKLDHALVDTDLSDYTEAELRTLLGLPAAE
ncbi:MAG: hypothetical protein IJT94_08290 [Oscillibacter sp.]|nr:hypothetical protein [Oscillibacter sp.]